MNSGKACAICLEIDSDRWTKEEKIEAIYTMANMETHNGITKEILLKVIRYLIKEVIM